MYLKYNQEVSLNPSIYKNCGSIIARAINHNFIVTHERLHNISSLFFSGLKSIQCSVFLSHGCMIYCMSRVLFKCATSETPLFFFFDNSEFYNITAIISRLIHNFLNSEDIGGQRKFILQIGNHLIRRLEHFYIFNIKHLCIWKHFITVIFIPRKFYTNFSC